MVPYRTGSNYTIVLESRVASCRVVSVKSMSTEEGALAAKEIAHTMSTLAHRADLLGALLDLRAAPKVAGPVTQAALASIFQAWIKAAKRVGVLSEDPMQVLQMKRIVETEAKTRGLVTASPEVLMQFLSGRDGAPDSK